MPLAEVEHPVLYSDVGTKNESSYFIIEFGEDFYRQWLATIKEVKLAQLTEEEKQLVLSYSADIKGEKSYEGDTRLFGQIWFNAPFMRATELQAMAGGKTYAYYFRVESSIPMMKSGHAIGLSSVFNYPEETYVTGRPLDATFSKTMRKLWVQFAKCGNPSFSVEISPDGKALEWPLYDVDNKYVMVFDEFDIHVATEPEVGIVDWDRTYFLPNHYDIWGDGYFSPSGVAFGVMLSGSNEA